MGVVNVTDKISHDAGGKSEKKIRCYSDCLVGVDSNGVELYDLGLLTDLDPLLHKGAGERMLEEILDVR